MAFSNGFEVERSTPTILASSSGDFVPPAFNTSIHSFGSNSSLKILPDTTVPIVNPAE